jgi:hypothetical protein
MPAWLPSAETDRISRTILGARHSANEACRSRRAPFMQWMTACAPCRSVRIGVAIVLAAPAHDIGSLALHDGLGRLQSDNGGANARRQALQLRPFRDSLRRPRRLSPETLNVFSVLLRLNTPGAAAFCGGLASEYAGHHGRLVRSARWPRVAGRIFALALRGVSFAAPILFDHIRTRTNRAAINHEHCIRNIR